MVAAPSGSNRSAGVISSSQRGRDIGGIRGPIAEAANDRVRRDPAVTSSGGGRAVLPKPSR